MRLLIALLNALLNALLALIVALGAAGPAKAQTTAVCQRDLLVADSALKVAVDKLTSAASGSEQDRCAAWRNQVSAVKRAREIYGRCAPERARTPQFLQTAGGANDLERVIKERCK
jgi:hypothetical protein